MGRQGPSSGFSFWQHNGSITNDPSNEHQKQNIVRVIQRVVGEVVNSIQIWAGGLTYGRCGFGLSQKQPEACRFATLYHPC